MSTHPMLSADLGVTRPPLPSSNASVHTQRAQSKQLHPFAFCFVTCVPSASHLPTDYEPLAGREGAGLATGHIDQDTPGTGKVRA